MWTQTWEPPSTCMRQDAWKDLLEIAPFIHKEPTQVFIKHKRNEAHKIIPLMRMEKFTYSWLRKQEQGEADKGLFVGILYTLGNLYNIRFDYWMPLCTRDHECLHHKLLHGLQHKKLFSMSRIRHKHYNNLQWSSWRWTWELSAEFQQMQNHSLEKPTNQQLNINITNATNVTHSDWSMQS